MPSAIWLRAEFPVHKTRILFLGAAWFWITEITANRTAKTKGADTFKVDKAFPLSIKGEYPATYLQSCMIDSGLIALFRVQHSEYKNDRSS